MNKPAWVLVGGDSLAGKEIRDLLADRRMPATLKVCSTAEDERVLTEEEGELAVMEPLTADVIEAASVVFLAGPKATHERAMALAAKAGVSPVMIDLTGALENVPLSRLRAPSVESEPAPGEAARVQVIAHPAAMTLARLLILLHAKHPVRHAVATVLEPVSAQGHAGIDELHKQTVSLLAFQPMPKDLFDTQVSFNVLPRFGEEAKADLAASQARLARHLVTLLGARNVPLPSVRMIHAPVFHGYLMTVWVDFVKRPAVAALEGLLRDEGIDVRTADVEPPSNLAVAGQSGITVGEVSHDDSSAQGAWFFVGADNLRVVAENAVLVAGLATRKA